MRTRALALGLAALALGGRAAAAQETTLSLRLEDAVRTALERNLDLEIERVRPQIAHEQIREAQAAFSPLFSLSATYADNTRWLNTVLEQFADEGLVHDTLATPETSLGGKFTSGTEYNFTLSAPKFESDNPLRLFDTSYVPVARLSLTQPLLRGFGTEVNTVRIKQAVKQERQAVLAVEARMLALIRDVEIMYWEVQFAQRALEVAQGNLAVAEDLIRRLERMKGAGLATALDLAQAQAAGGARRADLARAGADLLNAQSRLRQLVDPRMDVATRIVATEGPIEAAPPDDLPGKIARGTARRPEIRIQESVLESLALEERLAKDNSQWSLDAVGGATYGGLAGRDVNPVLVTPLPNGLVGQEDYLDAFRDGQTSWMLGLRLSIPLGNRDALAGLQTARQRLRQEELRLTLFKSQVSVEIETAFQDMTAERARLDSAREQVTLAGRQLDAEERSLEAGRTTVRRVLEAQDHLASARILEQRALTNYSAGRSRLNAALGTSLDAYHLVVQP